MDRSDQTQPLSTTTPETRSAGDSNVARVRREQIIAAAVEIITSQGLHNLSLSKIETRAGMRRGQLTYYFPTKEDILLAVFDRLLVLIVEHFSDGQDPWERDGIPNVWECVRRMLDSVLNAPPKFGSEFHALQYTFLAQIAHRADFRERLASLYAEWRQGMAAHWHVTAKPAGPLANKFSGKSVASFVQALMHGLTVQLAADPAAFDRTEMLELCVGMLTPLFTTLLADPPAKEPTT